MNGKILRRKARLVIMILLTALMVMVYVSIVGARNYAVLISAEESDRDNHEYNSEFWYDLFLMYETLIDYGYTHENIYVLYGNGSDSPYTLNGRYDASECHPEWGIEQITDYPNDEQYIDDLFTWLAEGEEEEEIPKITEHDNLFVWWKGHGEVAEWYPRIYLYIDHNIGEPEEEEVYDYEFDEWAGRITDYRYKIFWFETCYSGGMIDDLEEDSTFVHTSSGNGRSYCGTGNWDTCHGKFSYCYISALQWLTPGGNSVNADDDNNGLISIWEAFDYAWSNITGQTPQYSETGYNQYVFSCGHITRNTRLYPGDDMFFAGDIVVNSGAILQLDPSVKVTFDANSDDYDGGQGEYSSNKCELVVQGKLVAVGDESDRIIFQSTENSPGDWYGIVFKNGSDDNSEIKWSVIRDAKYGIYAQYTHLKIEKNEIKGSSGIGVYLMHSSPTVFYDNYIEDHVNPYGQGIGILCYYSSAPFIRHNKIADNSTYGLKCFVCANPKLIGVNTTDYYGANIIESNGSDEVYVNSNSTANLGVSTPWQEKGKNTIQDNSGYLVRNDNTSQVVSAEYNYWGGTPSSGRFVNVDYVPYESSEYTEVGPSWQPLLGKRLAKGGQSEGGSEVESLSSSMIAGELVETEISDDV